jgi:hypothetical protein
MLLSGKAEIAARSNNKLASVVIVDHASRRDFRSRVFAKLGGLTTEASVMVGPGAESPNHMI